MKTKRKTALKKRIGKPRVPDKLSIGVYYGFEDDKKLMVDVDSMTEEFEWKVKQLLANKKKYKWVK